MIMITLFFISQLIFVFMVIRGCKLQIAYCKSQIGKIYDKKKLILGTIEQNLRKDRKDIS